MLNLSVVIPPVFPLGTDPARRRQAYEVLHYSEAIAGSKVCSFGKAKVMLPLSVRRQGNTGEFCLDPVRNAIITQGELRPIVHVEGR